MNDLRFALRQLLKNPGFTGVAVLTLALGIGANTAIFSGINAILFRPLPGAREAERLCHIKLDDERERMAYADYVDFQERNRTLAGIAACEIRETEWRFDAQQQSLRGELVSGNYFQVLGVAAALGRVLSPADETVSADNVVVLGDATWRNHFAANPAIIGKQVIINNQAFTAVGVTPPEFPGSNLPNTPAWWMAIKKAVALNLFSDLSNQSLDERGHRDFNLIGRLKPGISLRQAQAELAVIFAGFKRLKPEVYQDRFVSVEAARGFKFSSQDRNQLYTFIAITSAVVSLTLLLACANIASFLLARAMSRRREIALRLALGASRWRIIRVLLTESLLLAVLGGMAALALTFWVTDLMTYALSLIAKQGLLFNFSPDWRVFAAALLISLLAGVLCGLASALQASKADLTEALKDDTSWLCANLRRFSWRNALVVAQVAGSLVLLAGAGLFLRSMQQALQFDLGYESQNLSFCEISVDSRRYSAAQSDEFFRSLQSRVAALPEVQSVCLADGMLLDNRRYRGRDGLWLADAEKMPFGDRKIEQLFVSPKFFATAGIPLVSGRDFTERDRLGSQRVIIINEVIARRAFPGRNPVGQQLRLQPNSEPLEIIGVAKNAKHHSLGEGAEPYFYRPLDQLSGYRGNYLVLFIRTQRDPAAIPGIVSSLVRGLDVEIRFSQSTVAENISRNVLPSKIALAFFGLFGALGLLLAAVGLSGVLAYAVARRTKEIGVRMALGANRSAVLRLIVGEGMALTLTGIVIGLLLALALTPVLANYLYGISSADPLTFVGVSLLLVSVAVLACWLPARRAAKVDPLEALRCE